MGKYCRFPVYNRAHICHSGYSCQLKHVRYEWPGALGEKGIIVSDSLLKYVRHLEYTRVVAYPGAKAASFVALLRNGTIKVDKSFAFICLGTNETQGNNVPNIVSNIDALVSMIRRRSASCKIVVATVLPRGDDLNSVVVELNNAIVEYAKDNDFECLRLHRALAGCIGEEGVLAKDRLHLGKKGVKIVFRYLQSYLRETYSKQD